ncbi:MAG: hypothetical protein AAFO69_06610 [Bacteroidota bacterium]
MTGQNPWSTWKLAETMIKQMGYEPKPRIITPEENAIEVLSTFQKHGYDKAHERISKMALPHIQINRVLLAQHSIVAAMQWKLLNSFRLIKLLKFARDKYE